MKANQRGVKLTGQRNQCPTCDEFFNSNSAFDKHRTGTIGVDRRCMTIEEMTARGMEKNKAGFWCTELMPENRVFKSE